MTSTAVNPLFLFLRNGVVDLCDSLFVFIIAERLVLGPGLFGVRSGSLVTVKGKEQLNGCTDLIEAFGYSLPIFLERLIVFIDPEEVHYDIGLVIQRFTFL